MKKITLLTLLYSSIPMVIIIIFELSRIKDGYLSVEHAVIGDILLFILLGSSTFFVLLLVMYWKKTKPFIVGLLSLVLFPASFSAYILWGNIIFKDVTLLSLFMVLISVFYYLGKGNLFDQKKPRKVSPNKRREKPMKEILSITVLLILVFTGTAISQQSTSRNDTSSVSSSISAWEPLRIKYEKVPNSDMIIVHLSEMITSKKIISFDSPGDRDKNQPPLVWNLFKIKGIKSISLGPYQIHLEKSGVFSWDELRPDIEKVIRKYAK